MSSSTDRIRETREAIELWDDILTHHPGSDLAYYLVLDAARSFVEGELPPDFPNDEDVKIGAKGAANRNPDMPGWANLPAYWRNQLKADVRAALVAVAESRRAAHLPGDTDG